MHTVRIDNVPKQCGELCNGENEVGTESRPLSLLALAPVVEGFGSRRLYPRKDTTVDHVSLVFVARVDRGIFFTIRQKRIRGGSTYAEYNSGPLKQRRLLL